MMTEPGEEEPDTDADPDSPPPDGDPSPETDRSDGTPSGAPEQDHVNLNREGADTQDGRQSPSSEHHEEADGQRESSTVEAKNPGRDGQPAPAEPAGTDQRSSPRGENRQGPTAAGSDSNYARKSREQTGREHRNERESDSWTLVVRDVAVTVLAVLLVGAYLFAISGVWPPMVAIESGSMEPNMDVNDMVFVMDEGRFQPAAATGDTGVVTAQTGAETGYGEFGNSGDVIIFEPGGNGAETPIIHRAMFWVEEGENWCEQGNPEYLGSLQPDDAVCEADHAGFITKGDANGNYDQASIGRATGPVRPEWIIGTAELRLPRLGWFRLQF